MEYITPAPPECWQCALTLTMNGVVLLGDNAGYCEAFGYIGDTRRVEVERMPLLLCFLIASGF